MDIMHLILYNIFMNSKQWKGIGMEKGRRLFSIIKAILFTLLFCTAIYFENAQRQRLYALVFIFALYLAVGFGRGLIRRYDNLYFLSFILDIALVYTLEYNSRLLINYFFHSFYIAVLLESSLLWASEGV